MKNSVENLIYKLNKIKDKNIKVVLEGCDCYGDFNGFIGTYLNGDGEERVLIGRERGYEGGKYNDMKEVIE